MSVPDYSPLRTPLNTPSLGASVESAPLPHQQLWQPQGRGKLAFFRGRSPAFSQDSEPAGWANAQGPTLALTDQDNTLWAGAYSGTVDYPREIAAANRPIALEAASDSITSWRPETGVVGRKPTHPRTATGNFFASDPMQFRSTGGGFVAGMSGGGALAADGTYSPGGGGAQSFLVPGTRSVRPVYRQNYYGPVNPTMSTKDLQASTLYNPLPSFSTVVPRLP